MAIFLVTNTVKKNIRAKKMGMLQPREFAPGEVEQCIDKLLIDGDKDAMLDESVCFNIRYRCSDAIYELEKKQRARPFDEYDEICCTTSADLLHLRVIGCYCDKQIILIQFADNTTKYILSEYDNIWYSSSIASLRDWFLVKPDGRQGHSTRMLLLLDKKNGDTDNIRFVRRVDVLTNRVPVGQGDAAAH